MLVLPLAYSPSISNTLYSSVAHSSLNSLLFPFLSALIIIFSVPLLLCSSQKCLNHCLLQVLPSYFYASGSYTAVKFSLP